MRKIHIFLFAFLGCACILFNSCQSVNKDKVKETVENFFSAYRGNDVSTAYSIYPKLKSLRGNFRKSSSIDLNIDDIWVMNDSNIIVNLTHHWVNPFGVDNTAKMRLFLTKKEEGYEIVDSKNFCMYDEVDLYTFACKTGAIILGSDTTDVAISAKIDKVEPMFNSAKEIIKLALENGLNISSMNWQTGYYSDYASGRAIVTNNTPYPVRKPEYTITYCKNDGSTVTSDNGTVCYDILMPMESRSFSWYTSYVGNANRARVTVECNDNEWIDEMTANLPFNGTEYYKYLTNQYWWPF